MTIFINALVFNDFFSHIIDTAGALHIHLFLSHLLTSDARVNIVLDFEPVADPALSQIDGAIIKHDFVQHLRLNR